jgi:hypothetical protein
MGRDQNQSGDTSQFEWINAWAAQCKPDAVSIVQPVAAGVLTAAKPGAPAIAPPRFVVPSWPDDQLMRDIAEIERVRDRLAAIPIGVSTRRMQAFTLAPSRTTDPVPVVVGGVLALVMLTVFGAAAAMSKLSR